MLLNFLQKTIKVKKECGSIKCICVNIGQRTTCILVNRIIYKDSCWQETDFIIAGERRRDCAYKEQFLKRLRTEVAMGEHNISIYIW